ncbi:hypothetical protein HC752_24150 [Vibrio sp. S9_S30]|uniref:hypothetical protein n=1 Tax=Vibrio sp. S9_S30 TaxID=2720226 RepID=UPI0016814267|nr:hypothetical protein [Vibrio sp. S9_S30]MBD1560014.1 hypothetical protein [Vibrio sp. S9_S30]
MEIIERVEILENGQLILVLASGGDPSYQYIYREAAEVSWDNSLKAFKSPVPRDWTYSDWFHHVIKVAKKCNIKLELAGNTSWVNVSDSIKEHMIAVGNT